MTTIHELDNIVIQKLEKINTYSITSQPFFEETFK